MVTELEEVPMSIVGGLDIHRKQLTFDWVDEQNDQWERGRIAWSPVILSQRSGWPSINFHTKMMSTTPEN